MDNFKNRSKYYRKGKVFVVKKYGFLARVISYQPQTAASPEIVEYEQINVDKPIHGEVFGDLSKYLYDIDAEIDSYDK